MLHWFGTCTDIADIVHAREIIDRSREELDALVRERTAMLESAQEAMRQSQKLEAMGQLTGGVAQTSTICGCRSLATSICSSGAASAASASSG